MDKHGNEAPPGDQGEIMIRGDNVMKGYYKAPDLTAKAIRADGWFHTGDLGYMDGDGYVFVTGRIKELIIKGGENIAPREIDEVLYQHPAVLEAAAVGVADEHYGEEIMGCVVLKPDCTATEEELRCHCIKHLGEFKTPKKIAFLQCIGSRNDRSEKYCSSICCMYTTKEAMIAYEHDNNLESYIFYIDMRAGGKGFQTFLKRGAEEYNIKYVKSKAAQVQIDKDENPIIVYEDLDSGKIMELQVDLAVLATCIIPPQGIEDLASTLGVELDDYKFIKTNPFYPVETSKDGIFTCGCVHEPMDIPRSVSEASGAAARAAEIIKRG